MNATTEQAEGWQRDMRERNLALAQMAQKIHELEAEKADLEEQNEILRDALYGITTGPRSLYLPV